MRKPALEAVVCAAVVLDVGATVLVVGVVTSGSVVEGWLAAHARLDRTDGNPDTSTEYVSSASQITRLKVSDYNRQIHSHEYAHLLVHWTFGSIKIRTVLPPMYSTPVTGYPAFLRLQ